MELDKRITEISSSLYRVAVKAIIIDSKKVLMVMEEDDDFWSFPGGGIVHGESVLKAIYRELEEECGLEPKYIHASRKPLHFDIGAVSRSKPKANIFYSVKVDASKIKKTPNIQRFGWFSLSELKLLDHSPSIHDIKSIFNLLETLIRD